VTDQKPGFLKKPGFFGAIVAEMMNKAIIVFCNHSKKEKSPPFLSLFRAGLFSFWIYYIMEKGRSQQEISTLFLPFP